MKYNYQLFLFVIIFMAGYCSNLLLPFGIIAPETPPLELIKNSADVKNKSPSTNNNYSSNTASNKNCVEPGVSVDASTPKSSQSISAEKKSLDGADDLVVLHNELAMLRDYRMQTEITKHNEYLQAHGGHSVEARNDSFQREPIDAGWAKDKESLINHLVNDSEHLSQMPHLAGECRSTQCKFSVLSDDQFYLNKLSASLDQVIAEHGASFASYSTIIDEKSHTTSIYFERK